MAYDYSLDDAWYALGETGVLASDDDNIRGAYAHVLVRLPPKIRHFALERIIILTIGRTAQGICWPASILDRRRRKWLIVMDENFDGDLESAIAHEIAHAWLGHNHLMIVGNTCEADADGLAVEWGFSKSYPDLQPG